MSDVLMPRATAVWLLDNTTLTFAQIAKFCGLHHLEVKGIADGDVAENMRGVDPIAGGILSREEIKKGEDNPDHELKIADSRIDHIPQPKRKGSRYTPVIRRADKPDAVAWFIRNHPEVSDAQVIKLIGTTKATINNVRDKSHWNASNIKPVDPVTLGLVGQLALDELVKKAADKKAKDDAKKGGATLQPADAAEPAEPEFVPEARERRGAEPTAESVFGKKD